MEDKGEIVIFGGGIGQPFVTTDYPSIQRAIEIRADAVFMAKQGTDGVYDSNPYENPNAKKFASTTYDDVIAKEIVDKYRHLCEKKITETDISIFDNLLELDLQDTSIKNIIDNAIEATKSFMSSIVSDSTWFMDSDQLRSAFNYLNDMKMYIQMQLLSSKCQK